jgi:hypothetical protein
MMMSVTNDEKIFKEGDKVRVVCDNSGGDGDWSIGTTGTIVDIDSENNYYEVELDDLTVWQSNPQYQQSFENDNPPVTFLFASYQLEVRHENNDKETTDSESLPEIIIEAVESFWSVITERLPHLDIGKLPPETDQTVADQMTSAVEKLIAAQNLQNR